MKLALRIVILFLFVSSVTLGADNYEGLPLKVAIIHSPADLGAIPSIFGKPQGYANFLDREISFNGPVPLLVVMPDGYGVAGLHAGVAGAVRRLRLPAGSGKNTAWNVGS